MFYVEHLYGGFLGFFQVFRQYSLLLACSTWNIFLIIATSSLFLVSCNEKEPNPELRDLIYQDMQAQEAESQKNYTEIQKKIDEAKKTLLESKVQTGEIKRNTRKFDDLVALKTKFEQQLLYWKARKYERMKFVRMKAQRLSKEEWSEYSKKEMAFYHSEKKLRQAKNSWDIKQRFKDSGFSYDPVLLGEEMRKPAKEEPKTQGH